MAQQLYPLPEAKPVALRDVAFIDRHGKTVIVGRDSTQCTFHDNSQTEEITCH